MTTPDYLGEWLSEVHRTARRFGLVFLQLGASQRPAYNTLVQSMPCVNVSETLNGELSGGPLAITNFEGLYSGSGDTPPMNVLRDRILGAIDQGSSFVLVSSGPRIRYPVVPGSSLLEDARFAHGPIVPPELRSSDVASAFPACREDGTPLGEMFSTTMSELGLEVCASLDQAFFELMLSPQDVLTTISRRELEALQGAGVVHVGGGAASWTVPTRLGEFRAALADFLSSATSVDASVTAVFEALWSVERLLRRAVREKAISVWGTKWRQNVLHGSLPGEVLERASVSAYAAAKSIAEIRDPLEWLTLGELLDLRSSRPEIGLLGIEKPLWKLMAADIIPIRNRISHMRLTKPDDGAMVKKWSKVLTRKLSAS